MSLIYPVIYLLQVCVGYHKKGYPDQSNKKSQKAKQAPTRSPVRRPQSIYILNLEPKTRLARPPRARTQTPPRSTPWALLGILIIITKSRLSSLNLVTVPKIPNLSLTPLKPSCHPRHDMRDAVLKYAIALLNK